MHWIPKEKCWVGLECRIQSLYSCNLRADSTIMVPIKYEGSKKYLRYAQSFLSFFSKSLASFLSQGYSLDYWLELGS